MKELLQHAQDNVWCNGRVDRYLNIPLAKVSSTNGYQGMIPEPYGYLPLPTKDAFQVYSLGSLTFGKMGHPNYSGDWVNIAFIATKNGIENAVTNEMGLRLPTTECWLRYGMDGSLLLAVRRSPILDNLLESGLRFTSYRNPSVRQGRFYTNGRVVKVDSDGLLIYNEYLQVKALGTATLYHNGFIVDGDLHPSDIKYKDCIHYEARTYGLEQRLFKISDLESFNSKVDPKRKLLLHIGNSDELDIHYYNDLDFKIFQESDGKLLGVNFHPKRKNDMRMVTHHDIALNNDLLEAFIAKLPTDFKATHIGITVKSDGMNKALKYERNYLKELYRLGDELVYPNLITTTNIIEEWNAINLETSMYNRVMESIDFNFTSADIVEAYGYNGVCQALEKSPLLLPFGESTLSLPVCLKEDSSFITYSKDGNLVDIYTDYSTLITLPNTVRCVDGLFGKISSLPTFHYNKQVTALEPNTSYRFLIATKVAGERVTAWTDAVEDEDYFIVNNRLTWYSNLTSKDVLIIANTKWPMFTLNVTEERMDFDLNSILNTAVGFDMGIQVFAYFELWVNRKRLIENVDYRINDGILYIQTKEYFKQDSTHLNQNEFKLLMNGFSNAEFEAGDVGDTGFVRVNKLSANHSYNLMDGINGTFIYGGGVYCREDVSVEDYENTGAVQLTNGLPYQFFTRVVTTNGLEWDKWKYYEESKQLAKKIEDYFNTLKEPVQHPITPINRLYPLVSITLHRIITDMVSRRLKIPHERLTNEAILDVWLKPYQREIDNDIGFIDFEENEVFVEVHPHSYYHYLDLSPIEYEFVARVNELVFNNTVKLDRYLRIGRD